MSSNKPKSTGVKPMPPWGEGPKPPVPFTEERKLRYLYELRRTGKKWLSAEVCGVRIGTVNDHRKKDPEFNEACEEALQLWVDEQVVGALIQRGVHGVEEPIFGGKFKDELVGHKRVYSDAALLQLAKANRPAEFREGAKDTGAYDLSNGGVLIIPAAPATIDDWQEQFGAMAKGTTGRPGGSQ
jgi:hypothetical protein